jgi:hypothetical protein
MYRVIYLDENSEYQTFDSEDYNIIADNQKSLKRCGNKIICIVDYYYNVILNKCRDFKLHLQHIDRFVF